MVSNYHISSETSQRKLTRRGFLGVTAQLGFCGLLFWRMRKLQVQESDKYQLLAEDNRINSELLPPSRGMIYDRQGRQLAINVENYRVMIVRERAGDFEEVLRRIQQIVPLKMTDLARIRRDIKKSKSYQKVMVAEHLTWQQVAQIAANSPALPGVTPELGLSRVYPEKETFSHIVGYVGPISDYDISKMEEVDPVLLTPRFQMGKSGVEAKLEKTLRGRAGNRQFEVNASQREMRELSRTEGDSGSNLQLTVDTELQEYVLKRLASESAAAVVIDIKNGDVLSLGSAPNFDPNSFVFGISSSEYKELIENDHRPLYNKSVSGVYPPGSTFKMVVGLAGLDSGLIGPGDGYFCKGYYEVGTHRFHCWSRGGHGWVAMRDSLKKSCDVYYYRLAEKVTIDRISAMAHRLGLGVDYDFPLPAVNEGLIPSREWKLKNRKQEWKIGDTLNVGIGQGFVLASPLHLAVMTARIASGKEVVPRLVRAVGGVPVPEIEFADLGIKSEHLSYVRRGMYAVVNEKGGTAYKTRLKNVLMAGKTGTSQVRRITADERRRGVTRNEDLPWKRRDHALFVCYAPYDNPRYAISVVVEHGGGGSAVAAPIARDIMNEVIRRAPSLQMNDQKPAQSISNEVKGKRA